jgi:biopolymer transport protein ExbB
MPFLSGYTLRKQITISHAQVDSDLTDFPLFVSISSDSDIGGECLANGHDIRFTSSDGTTLLKYERQSFSVSGGAATGTFWVKVPTVAGSSDTTIYLYYGDSGASDGADPTNVWDSSFLAVYHLEESGNGTSGEYKDSTSNARHLTGGSGAFPSRSTGLSSYGQTFDGTNDHMVGSAPTLNGSSAATLELFFKTSTNQTGKYLASNPLSSAGSNGFDIHLNGTAAIEGWMNTTTSAGINRTSLTYADSAWHQVAQTYGGGDYKLYFDGAQAGSTVSRSGNISSTTEFNIGRFGTFGAHVAADIDEVRVSNVARSAAWLKFTYHNLKSAGNELTFGSEESDVVPPPRVYLPWYLHWMPSEEFIQPATSGPLPPTGNRRRRLILCGSR